MYYRLTYISTANKKRTGDSVLNGYNPLSIGQGAACHVLLPESDKYEPQTYASILSKEDGENWYIIRRTDCYQVHVNGDEVPIAQALDNGDILAFSDGTNTTELKFETFNDGEYDARSGLVYQKHKASSSRQWIVTILVALLALGVASFAIWTNWKSRQQDIKLADLSDVTKSIYHITTDSVYLRCDSIIDGERRQVVVKAIELADVAAGTVFLTDDSLFVTARHCIEPWINDEEWDGVSSKSKMSPEVRLATMAETGNRSAGYQKYTLSAHCLISKGMERYDYYSSDFYMNKSRDLVMRLGNRQEEIYWRTIFPIAHRRDMELGDFAYLKAEKKGDIALAGLDDILKTTTPGRNQNIAVIGFPLTDVEDDDVADPVFGNLMSIEYNKEDSCFVGCIKMSANINRGNSGGPVFAMIDGRVKAIGIVSKADGRATQGVFWAVPTTEVVSMRQNGNSIKKDTLTFRR